jgi:hypothetical protein
LSFARAQNSALSGIEYRKIGSDGSEYVPR